MIKIKNIEALQKQLEELQKTVERKLKAVVKGFAYDIAYAAVSKTPLGSAQDFPEYYARRTLLPNVEGIARGNWQMQLQGETAELVLVAGQDSGTQAVNQVKRDAEGYKLGDTFAIVNTAPYIMALEHNHSPQTNLQGIYEPAKDLIMAAYKVDFPVYYEQG